MYQELQKGWLEVITGPMFAGKSEELIRRVKTLSYTKMKIIRSIYQSVGGKLA